MWVTPAALTCMGAERWRGQWKKGHLAEFSNFPPPRPRKASPSVQLQSREEAPPILNQNRQKFGHQVHSSVQPEFVAKTDRDWPIGDKTQRFPTDQAGSVAFTGLRSWVGARVATREKLFSAHFQSKIWRRNMNKIHSVWS